MNAPELVDSGLAYCTAHHGVIECDEGDGPCDNVRDHRDAVALHPCLTCGGEALVTVSDGDYEGAGCHEEPCPDCDEGFTLCKPTPLLYEAASDV